MTKADPLEEPCARKLACTVLQTSGGSDPFAEFNNSHQPTRQRERRMQRCKSPGHAQRFLSAYGPIAQHFRPRRHRFAAPAYRQELQQKIPDLAGDHDSSPGCLREEIGETPSLLLWSCIRANKLTMPARVLRIGPTTVIAILKKSRHAAPRPSRARLPSLFTRRQRPGRTRLRAR